MNFLSLLVGIVFGIFVAIYAIAFCALLAAMIARMAYLFSKAVWKGGLKALRPSLQGNTWNDVA